MSGSGGIVPTLPVAPDNYSRASEAQFRRVVEQSLESISAEIRGRALDGDVSGLVLLSTQEVTSAVASVDFTTGIDDSYDQFLFLLQLDGSADANLIVRTSTDGGANFDAGATDYEYVFDGLRADGTNLDFTSSGIDYMVIAPAVDSAERVSAAVRLVRPSDTEPTFVYATGAFMYSVGPNLSKISMAGRRVAAAAVDAVRFAFLSGNIESGVISLYGVVK